MANTVLHSVGYSRPYIQYAPLTAGNGMEPAVSIASIIRNTLMNAPLTWYWNRNEVTFTTVAGQQDYAQLTVLDLNFIEDVSLTDDQGNITLVKDIYNTSSLGVSSFQQRPNAISVQKSDAVTGCVFRFLGVPDKIYTVTITYQKIAPQFGPFFITAAANAVGGNTTYTGIFDTASFPAGSIATISGYPTASVVNNGSFPVISVTTTSLVVANASGVVSTQAAFVSNLSWGPIPDQFSDIYNNLFLSEALSAYDDPRSQLYRQRGVAAFMATATGLTETQKNAFTQQWLARDTERQASAGTTQLGNAGRGV